MSSLADLVQELPARVHRAAGASREQLLDAPWSNEVHEQWLRDLDAEAATRSAILPAERHQRRRAEPQELQEGILADLLYEMRRNAINWGEGSTQHEWHGDAPKISVKGPAPVNNEGVLSTLKSYLEAEEPCDRFDSLLRHAATTLLLAERIAAGNA